MTACLALAAGLLPIAVARPAAASFSAPVVVGRESPLFGPLVAGAPDGRAAIAWTASTATGGSGPLRLVLRGRGERGTFGAVQTVSDSGPFPAVAIGAAGDVAVTWQTDRGAVLVRRAAPGAGLDAGETLLAAPPASFTAVAGVDGAGNTIVAYIVDSTLVARWARRGAPFGEPQALAGVSASFGQHPSLLVTGTGRALVGFADLGGRAAVTAARLDGASGPAHRLAPASPAGGVESSPRLAPGAAVWTRAAAPGFPLVAVMSAVVAGDGVPSAQRTVHGPAFVAHHAVGGGPRRAVAAWVDPSVGIGAAVGVSAASLGAPFAVARDERESVPLTAAVDGSATALLLWTHTLSSGFGQPTISELRAVAVTAAPCPPVALARGTIGHPQVAMDAVGGGLATWADHAAGMIFAARWRAGDTACDSAAGAVRLAATHATVRIARRPLVRIALRCGLPTACRGPATLRAGGIELARGRLRLTAGRRGTLALRPRTRRATQRLRRRGTLAARLTLRIARAGAPSQPVALPVRVRIRR